MPGEAAAGQATVEGEELDDFVSTPAAILDKVVDRCVPLPLKLDEWDPEGANPDNPNGSGADVSRLAWPFCLIGLLSRAFFLFCCCA